MKEMILSIPKGMDYGVRNSDIGVKEYFKVEKRKNGKFLHLTVGMSPNMQPLKAYTKKAFNYIPIQSSQDAPNAPLYYMFRDIGYIVDIKYTIYEDGTDNFVYAIYIPKKCDEKNSRLYCDIMLGLVLKSNLREYYKQVCEDRLNFKYKPSSKN